MQKGCGLLGFYVFRATGGLSIYPQPRWRASLMD